jgi:hypothetical protein
MDNAHNTSHSKHFTFYICLKQHKRIKLLGVDSLWFILTCPSWQVAVGAVLFLPWQEEQAKAWKQTCVPRIHTKECGYLGLPQDTSMYCKNLNWNLVLVSWALGGQAVPDDAPETMKQDCTNVVLQLCNQMARTHVMFSSNTTLQSSKHHISLMFHFIITQSQLVKSQVKLYYIITLSSITATFQLSSKSSCIYHTFPITKTRHISL